MNAAARLILVFAATIQVKDDSASQQAARSRHEQILKIYTNDADEYTIYRDASRNERVELRREPVLVCSNPTREGGDGAVFVWTCRGRAEVIGTFVTSTDPEALLVIEARKPSPADGPVWNYAVCRLTDLGLVVRRKGKEVFTAPLIPYNSPVQDAKQRFRAYHDRNIPAVEETNGQ